MAKLAASKKKTSLKQTNLADGTPAQLALADGKIFKGIAFGAARGLDNPITGEVVFNTSMFGYQEILTDPSYAGQILCFTCPHIGNVGCNLADEESSKVHVEGVIIRNLSKITSNYRSELSLSEYLARSGLMGIAGIDTRELVAHLRNHGSQMGTLACGEVLNSSTLVDVARAQGSMLGKEYVTTVSCKTPYTWNELPYSLEKSRAEGKQNSGYKHLEESDLWARPHVVALDCGIKFNILRLLLESGFRVSVVPALSKASEILALKPDGLFLSNGPGDPATLQPIVKEVKSLLGQMPIFGICLGHQILGQALGGKTYKLKFGHRGGNHPVKDLTTGKVEITVQNHGFAVDPASLSKDIEITHLNLNDQTVEGLQSTKHRAFSIQYHPEASPGPHDASYLFRRFFANVVGQDA